LGEGLIRDGSGRVILGDGSSRDEDRASEQKRESSELHEVELRDLGFERVETLKTFFVR
jgi:hypothetical protein